MVLTFNGSSGEIDCDETGKVVAVRHDAPDGSDYSDIARLDLVERAKWWADRGLPMGENGLVDGDVLDCGGWTKDGVYFEPCFGIREQWLDEQRRA